VVEDDVDEDGKMMIVSVLTEVTVTVAALDEDELAADVESDDWEEHRAERERETSIKVNAIVQTSVDRLLQKNRIRSGRESHCKAQMRLGESGGKHSPTSPASYTVIMLGLRAATNPPSEIECPFG
jgi:hypothetical protein